jgi:ABC-type Fe3+ transport system permease subunit
VGTDQVIADVVLIALMVALVMLAASTSWRQLRILRQPEGIGDPLSTEGQYRRAQIRRRLISSGLMLVLAAQLTGALFYIEERAQRQADRADAREAARQRGEEVEPTPEERSFARFYGWYWLAILVVLLAVFVLALTDLWSTRRFAIRAHRQLRDDRRAMIEHQIARMRREKQERNGHG